MNAHFAILVNGALAFGILADPQSPKLFTDVILPAVPWILILAFVLLFLPRIRRQKEQAAKLNQRATEHWDAVERKLDRLIELLETRRNERQNLD